MIIKNVCYLLLVFISNFIHSCVIEDKKAFEKTALENIPEKINYSKEYDGHLQGMATDFKNFIFWSHTTQLVKTDLKGNILKLVDVQNHHGDLEYYKGKLYVAVNFGKFNEEPGLADSWIYVYSSEDLKLTKKYPVPEVVHGAGGIAIHNDQAMVVGGLPGNGNYTSNFVYQYDLDFNLRKRHVLDGGYTYLGIQTACYFNSFWYFACYGNKEKGYIPQVLKVKQDENNLKLIQSFRTDMSYGMIGLEDDKFLVSSRYLNKCARIMELKHQN